MWDKWKLDVHWASPGGKLCVSLYCHKHLKNILPPLGNEFIAMLKDSSLVSVIGFEELTRRGQLIIAQTYGSFEIWMTVAVLYLIMTMAISRIVAFLEKR